jgi:hypothetical protein
MFDIAGGKKADPDSELSELVIRPCVGPKHITYF